MVDRTQERCGHSYKHPGYAPVAPDIRQKVGADLENKISARLEKIKSDYVTLLRTIHVD